MSAQAYAGTMTVGTAAQASATAPGATAAVVCGILGIFIAGIILGPVAIAKANGGKGQHYEDAISHLNIVIACLKDMKKGEK